MDKIVLELTVDDVNRILTSLSKMPFEYVNTLIGKVHGQTSKQVAQTGAATNAGN